MKISKRLQEVATFTSGYNSLADIACDHGLLGIYCRLQYNISDILLSDINPEPLEQAKNNLNKYHVTDIKLALGDGFKTLPKDYECIALCGIGGFLMRDIINEGILKAQNAKRLILCPNSDSYEVRKVLDESGFVIDYEKMVLDYKYYEIIVCHYEDSKPSLTELERKYGKLHLENKSKEFLGLYTKKLNEINKSLSFVTNEEKKNELLNYKKELESILN